MSRLLIWENFIAPGKRNIPKITPQKQEEFDDEDEDDFDEKGPQGSIVLPNIVFSGSDNPLLYDRELFMANTNFVITSEDVSALESCPGIEAFKLVSKYCFVVAVGKMFESALVLLQLEKLINVSSKETIKIDEFASLEEEDLDKIIDGIKEVSDKNEFWAIYVFPNGRIFSKTYPSQDELENDKELFEDLAEFSEGVMYFSHDD